MLLDCSSHLSSHLYTIWCTSNNYGISYRTLSCFSTTLHGLTLGNNHGWTTNYTMWTIIGTSLFNQPLIIQQNQND